MIEIGDIVRPVRYTVEDAGKAYKVTDIQTRNIGDLILAEHRGGRGIEVRKFYRGDVVVVHKGQFTKAQFEKGGHINHDCFVRPFGEWPNGEGEVFWPKPPSPSAKTFLAVDGTAYSVATVDTAPDGLPNHIIIHTNEVQEDTAVRLEYTTPSTENFKAKLDECERELEVLAKKVEKSSAKAVKHRQTHADVRRERDRIAVEAEKASLGMPLEPAPSRYSSTVITFVKKFGNTYGKEYGYAALRAPGLSTWSVTGKSELTYATWEQVVEFILREEKTFTHRRKALQSIRLR